MALAILDGTQTATTLSTILSSGQHITAHTVVSLGTQAITDILNATSAGLTNTQLRASAVTIGGTVTIGAGTAQIGSVIIKDANGNTWGADNTFPVVINSGNVNLVSAIPAGTSRIGVVTIGAGTVTIGAGTAQIGSVTASISGTVPISISSVTIGNTVAIAGTVTANLSISSTAITSGSFASLTSATLVPGNVARKMATVFNQGAGQLFVNAGATATTVAGGFMMALSSGDFYECNYTTTTLSAIFATAGTASWVSH